MNGRRRTLGLGVDLAGAVDVCRRRLEGDDVLCLLDGVNLGMMSGDTIPPELPKLIRDAELSVVVHAVDINLSTTPSEAHLRELRRFADVLGVEWYEEDLGIWEWNGMYLGNHQLNPVQDRETLLRTAENVRHCAAALERPFLIENPPVYYSEGDLDMWTYLAETADAADCGLVVDVGHMIGYHINADRDVEVAPTSWRGWNRVREIHLSGFEVLRIKGVPMWFDRHSLPFGKDLLAWARTALERIPGPCAICLELDGAPDPVVRGNIAAVWQLVAEVA
jgi:uncharacterized protein (UPF0276 family)